MPYHKKICIIGASNVDITGFTNNKLIYQDANIGSMKTAAGGVGRNIAENLALLQFNVDLISVFGDDPLSHYIIDYCNKHQINIANSLFLKDASASTFIAIMDEHNDLALGISAMSIFDELQPDFILSKLPHIADADLIVLETNFSEEILKTIVEHLPQHRYVLDTVSGVKSLRALPILEHLYILKTNLIEAEMMSGLPSKTDEDIENLVRWFLKKGVKNVFITLGENGVYYGNKEGIHHQKAIHSKVVNTIGAGDSFVAGLIYADSLKKDIHTCAFYGMAAASLTVQHNEAVNPEMCIENLEKKIK